MKHPEERLIERLPLSAPESQARRTPAWRFSQLPSARKIAHPPGEGEQLQVRSHGQLFQKSNSCASEGALAIEAHRPMSTEHGC